MNTKKPEFLNMAPIWLQSGFTADRWPISRGQTSETTDSQCEEPVTFLPAEGQLSVGSIHTPRLTVSPFRGTSRVMVRFRDHWFLQLHTPQAG